MAAKLKKRNPFLAFLIYFLSISVFWGSLYVIILGMILVALVETF